MKWIKVGGGWRLLLLLAVLIVAGLLAAALSAGFFTAARLDGREGLVRSFVPENPTAQAAKLPKLVATFRDVPPDMIIYSEGRHSGPLHYVLEEAAARIGYAIEWKQRSFSSSLDGLTDGSVDIIPSAHHKTAEREKDARFSVSLGRQQRPIFFAQHQDDPRAIKTMADLKGHTVGHLKSSFYFSAFQSATHFTKVPYADLRGLMQGFIKGEADIIVLNNKKSAERELATLGFNKFKYADLVIGDDPDMFFLYSRISQHKEVFDRLDQALIEMENEGLVADIYRSFDADPPT